MWQNGLPALLGWRGDEHDAADPPQQPEEQHLFPDGGSGFGQRQQGAAASPVYTPDRHGDDVAGQHAEGNQCGGDYEEHPGQSRSGETHPTQEAFGHLGVRGGESHAGQRRREQPLGMVAVTVSPQEVQEAVEQACGGGHHREGEQEAEGAKALLEAAAEHRESRDAPEELSRGLVAKGERQQSVDVTVSQHGGADAERSWAPVQLRLGGKEEAREQRHGEDATCRSRRCVFKQFEKHFGQRSCGDITAPWRGQVVSTISFDKPWFQFPHPAQLEGAATSRLLLADTFA